MANVLQDVLLQLTGGGNAGLRPTPKPQSQVLRMSQPLVEELQAVYAPYLDTQPRRAAFQKVLNILRENLIFSADDLRHLPREKLWEIGLNTGITSYLLMVRDRDAPQVSMCSPDS